MVNLVLAKMVKYTLNTEGNESSDMPFFAALCNLMMVQKLCDMLEPSCTRKVLQQSPKLVSCMSVYGGMHKDYS